MRFESKSEEILKAEEEERRSASLFPDKAVVDFEITSALEKKSKSSGKDMFEIDLQTFDSAGNKKSSIRDWIVPETQMYKLHQLCSGIGLLDKYEAGEVHDYDLIGRSGQFVAGVDANEQYGTRNKVRSYVAASGAKASSEKKPMTKAESSADLDDDIPF